MICKWCGAVIRQTERVCGACGREIPPLSDCGGFYQLTRQTPPVMQQATAAPLVTVAPTAEQPAAESRNNTRALAVLGAVCAVLLVVCIVLAVMLLQKAPAASSDTQSLGVSEADSEETEPPATNVTLPGVGELPVTVPTYLP